MRIRTFLVGMLFIGNIFLAGFKPISAQNTQEILNDIYHHMSTSGIPPEHNINKTSHYPADFQIDDLVFFDTTLPPGRWNVRGLDHCAIYLGNDTFVCTMTNKTTGILEINIATYADLYLSGILKNPVYARVINATVEQRHNASKWALSRIGDLYQLWDPRKEADPNASMVTAKRWYCSEIIWAAYYHQGIDIDKNGWDRDFPWFFPIFSSVSPQDIYDDNDLIHLA
jgi:hypothetical protein